MSHNTTVINKTYTCCICGRKFHGYGNNPQPVSQNPKERCCDACNRAVVIPERIKRYYIHG